MIVNNFSYEKTVVLQWTKYFVKIDPEFEGTGDYHNLYKINLKQNYITINKI